VTHGFDTPPTWHDRLAQSCHHYNWLTTRSSQDHHDSEPRGEAPDTFWRHSNSTGFGPRETLMEIRVVLQERACDRLPPPTVAPPRIWRDGDLNLLFIQCDVWNGNDRRRLGVKQYLRRS
jgi:hypothetical protein